MNQPLKCKGLPWKHWFCVGPYQTGAGCVLPSSKSLLPDAELPLAPCLSVSNTVNIMSQFRTRTFESPCLGKGRESSSTFLKRLTFFLNQGSIPMFTVTQIHGWDFTLFSPLRRKTVNLSLLENQRAQVWASCSAEMKIFLLGKYKTTVLCIFSN